MPEPEGVSQHQGDQGDMYEWEEVQEQGLRDGQVLTPCLWNLKLREESGGGVLVLPGKTVVVQVNTIMFSANNAERRLTMGVRKL